MFQRFTRPARRVIDIAHDEACGPAGTEHILVGLLLEKAGSACHRLEDLGIKAENVRGQVSERGTSVHTDARLHPGFTPHARTAIEQAMRQSLSLRQHSISTEHLLLGLLAVDTCRGAQILDGLGVSYTDVSAEIIHCRSGWPKDAAVTRGPIRAPFSSNPSGVILERLAHQEYPTPDMSTAQILKERVLADRRFFVVTYSDTHDSQYLLFAEAVRHQDAYWFASASSGGPRPAPYRDGRWVYLEGWSDEDHLFLGGELLVDNAEASQVCLLLDDGTELVDDVTNGVVLFATEAPFMPPVAVRVRDSAGALLASHSVH